MIEVERASVSATVAAIPRSGIREIMDEAWRTPGAILLGTGEPDFPTPPHVVAAADAAARAGRTGYVSNAGITELREALAAKLARVNGDRVGVENVLVTSGGVEAIYATLAALLDPGDGILLPDPGWPNFAMSAAMLRARIVRYPLRPECGYLPDPAELERLADDGVRVLLVNSPSNPLGAIVGRERMRELGAFAAERGMWLLSDECYDECVFEGEVFGARSVCDPERTIGVYTFSKTYAMTGWRVGYVAAPIALAAVVAKLQEPLISCVNTPAQHAALAALTGPQDVVGVMRDAYRERRDEVCARLVRAGIPHFRPAGAFYAWIDARASGRDARSFAFALLRERGVAVAPGTAFGPEGEGWIRVSLATEPSRLYEGVDRIIAALR